MGAASNKLTDKLANVVGVLALLACLLSAGYWAFNQWRRRPEAPYQSYDEPTFGRTGIVENREAIAARGIAVLKDRRILVAGLAGGGDHFDLALLRFNTDGTPDVSFGNGGMVTADFGGEEQANGLAVDENGKIWVAGEFSAHGASTTLGVVRFDSQGHPDISFGEGGKALVSMGTGTGLARALVLDPGKGVVVAGFVAREGVRRIAAARLLSDGKPDSAFGQGGLTEVSVGPGHAEGFAVDRTSDGKLVVAGYGRTEDRQDFAVVRLDSNGKPDPAFGDKGVAMGGFAALSSYPYTVKVLPSGGVLVGGMSGSRSNYDFALAQWTADGKPDPAFGEKGQALIPIGPLDDAIHAMFRMPSGNIIAVGASASPSLPNALSLVKVHPDGSLDRWFGYGGKVVTSSDSYAGYAVDVQPNGKIVVAGNRVDPKAGNVALFVARYRPEGSLDGY